MNIADVRVGMRLRSRFDSKEIVTVTEITEIGFKYVLDTPVCLHPLLGTIIGGEAFGWEGDALYDLLTEEPMTALTDYARDRQVAYREYRRQWALAHKRPYREDGGKGMGRAPDPERMKLDTRPNRGA